MFQRKTAKKHARMALTKHYGLFLVVCVLAAFFQIDYYGSLGFLTLKRPFDGVQTVVLNGVVSKFVRDVFPESILYKVYSDVKNAADSHNLTSLLFMALSFAAFFILWFFFLNVYKAVAARIFLEGRLYEEVGGQRFIYFLTIRRWIKACAIMALAAIYRSLWSLTVVGGIIKRYSYYMVPYIVAENPDIGCSEAITLSRRMMSGHKWECFFLELSFIGWDILSAITLGLTSLFYSNMYREATGAEYYSYVRNAAKKSSIDCAGQLSDKYLFEKPSQLLLNETYEDALDLIAQPDDEIKPSKGVRAFLANVFGVTICYTKKDEKYQKAAEKKVELRHLQQVLLGHSYPDRLSAFWTERRRTTLEHLHYIRHYCLSSLILMFFSFSFAGWLWEVMLYIVMTGGFVNRGVLYGPWLPIYGSGALVILLLLNKLRQRPLAQFISAIVLCGVIEYFTSYFLEIAHDGRRWWDYTGYILNLNGRICAEGLLVFGLGGLCVVYLFAPLLDNIFKKISGRLRIFLCIILLIAFIADCIYSSDMPNNGATVAKDMNYSSAMGTCFICEDL